MSEQKTERFQVDLRGVLDVFSNHLYSTSDVFVRELVQNGADALRARRDVEPDFAGSVRFEPSRKGGVLTVIDDGIGLSEEQMREVLSRVGSSSKRGVDERARAGYIGQFGIGMLSCFMVCEEIVVISQSIDPDEPAVEWVASEDGTFTIRTLSTTLDVGTRVVLKLNTNGKKYLKSSVLGEVLRRYASMLDEDIVLKERQWDDRISRSERAWDLDLSKAQVVDEFKSEGWRWGIHGEVVDVFPLVNKRMKIRGIGVLDGVGAGTGEHRRHRVYSNGIFVTDQPEKLIPRWASFARIDIELNDIGLTASRESIYEDKLYGRVQSAVSKMLVGYLHRMAEENPELLAGLVAQNDDAFREIAFEDDVFFDAIIEHLVFETNMGSVRFGDFLREQSVIRVAPVTDQFRMIGPIAGARGSMVFNGGYTKHTELLEKAASRIEGVSVEHVDARSYVESLADPSGELAEEFGRMESLLSDLVSSLGCKSVLKVFEPSTMPAVYLEGRDETIARSLDAASDDKQSAWSSVIDTLRGEIGDGDVGRVLCLNANHPTIAALLGSKDEELIVSVWGMCYVRALLDARQPLTVRDSVLFTESLDALVGRCMQSGGER